MNAYLKELADLCGIDKNLTWYISRHTFATTVTLANGIKIEMSLQCLAIPILSKFNIIMQKYLTQALWKIRKN